MIGLCHPLASLQVFLLFYHTGAASKHPPRTAASGVSWSPGERCLPRSSCTSLPSIPTHECGVLVSTLALPAAQPGSRDLLSLLPWHGENKPSPSPRMMGCHPLALQLPACHCTSAGVAWRTWWEHLWIRSIFV